MTYWIRKLEISEGTYHLPRPMFLGIIHNVEDAFKFDFNMVIEEYAFYYALPPKMQTELVNLLFSDFIKNFS